MGALYQDRLADWPSVVINFDFDFDSSSVVRSRECPVEKTVICEML
jgi:hypothetical protein